MSTASVAAAPSSSASGLLSRLRVAHKILLGGGLLLLPTIALMHTFTVTANDAIHRAALERCGLRIDAHYRRLVRLEFEGAPVAPQREVLEQLRDQYAHPCGSEPLVDAATVDRLERHLADGTPLTPDVLILRSALANDSGLILDPQLDTYYVAHVLIDHVNEMRELLANPLQRGADRLSGEVDSIRRDLTAAIGNDAARSVSGESLAATIGPAFEAYVAAVRRSDAPGGAEAALDALFGFADAASAWEDRALQRRIEARRAWVHRTYAVVLAVVLLVAWFAWLTLRDSARQLRELIRLSNRIGRGDLAVAGSSTAPGVGELADLHRTLETMAGELGRSQADLERRVVERTAAAEAAEARFRTVVEAAPEAFVLSDSDGRIRLVNSQAESLFGYTRDEMIGQLVEMLIPTPLRAQHVKDRSRFARHPATRPMGAGRHLFARRKDGSEIPVEIGLSVTEFEGAKGVLAGVVDISSRIATEQLQREVEANSLRLAILQGLPASIIATDIAGNVVNVNPAAERLLGYAAGDLVGKPSLLIHDPDELQHHAVELSRLLGQDVQPGFDVVVMLSEGNQSDRYEWTFVRKDGSRVPVQLAVTALHDDTGRISGFLNVAHDIAARRRAEHLVQHMARHDALTGLPNRALLLDRLEAAVQHARRHDRKSAVLFLNLDRFKHANDSLGHAAGDEILRVMARRIETAVRASDTVARLGADEFAITVADVGSREEVATLAEAIFDAVASTIHVGESELRLAPSIGGALFPDDGGDGATLVMKADTAMNRAKKVHSGRALQWFEDSMLRESQEAFELSLALRHAQERGELQVHYQPEVSLKTGEVIGVEALMRWDRAGRSISPARFIPLAEDSGLIVPLGEWVLRQACRDGVRLQNALHRRLRVAVNVSPIQFQQKGWLDVVTSALAESGLHPSLLELEITETALMSDPEDTIAVLHALRKLGVSIVVDDFGTGYSSLAYVTRFPIDKIKIDRAFVRDLVNSAADAAVVNAIIAMARRLGIAAIAEGVETSELHADLQARGCDEAQGFLYSAALPLATLVERCEGIEDAARGIGNAVDRSVPSEGLRGAASSL